MNLSKIQPSTSFVDARNDNSHRGIDYKAAAAYIKRRQNMSAKDRHMDTTLPRRQKNLFASWLKRQQAGSMEDTN